LSSRRVSLEGSHSHIAVGLARSDPDTSARISATILVRRRPDPGSSAHVEAILRGEAPALSREEAAASLGADPADMERVTSFAAAEGLTILETNLARRMVRVEGTVSQMEAAFGTQLRACEISKHEYLCYEGPLSIPADLEGIIVGVLGLDQRPVARR
jgi:kumamolisin